MEATKWLKPSISVSRIGDSASVQAVTRVNAEQSSKRTMRISRSGCAIRDHGWRWHMFEEKREAVTAIEAAVVPLIAKGFDRLCTRPTFQITCS